MADGLLDNNNNQPVIDPNKNYLEELVGESKKFKTEQDLARGKYESDLYIETLKRQQDELRADYLKLRQDTEARANLEELINQLEAKQKTTTSTITPVANEVNKQPVIDPKDIESLIATKIQESKLNERQSENYNSVKAKLVEQYGPNYQTVLKQQIEDLGLTEEDITALARKSPAAFFKTMGLATAEQKETFQAPPRSNQRNDNFAPKGAPKRTWAYYQNMKKTDPKSYYDPKTNVQIHNDMLELGDAFKDGDYRKFDN